MAALAPAMVVAAALTLSGCGGGGGGSSENESEPENNVTGTVEKPAGVTLAERGWRERLLAAMAAVFPQAAAAITGLEPAQNVQVQVVRLNDDGTVAETLASGTTNSDGEFGFRIPDFEPSADTVVLAGTSDPMRAPASLETTVNPVSENVVRKVVERVASGSSFSAFSATELAVLVEIILDELEAAGVDFSGASNVEDAVSTADSGAGTVDEDLVADAEGDPGITLSGSHNLVNIGITPAVGESEARVSLVSQNIPTRFLEGPGLAFGGETITVFDTTGRWTFQGPGTFDFDLTQSSQDEAVPADEPPIFLSIGSSGRLNTQAGGKGSITQDGTRFVYAETRDTDLARLAFGTQQWSPGDFDTEFNAVRFVPYFDNTHADAMTGNEFFPRQIGNLTGTRFTLAMQCTSGDCNFSTGNMDGQNATADTNATDRAYYAQSGVRGFDTASPRGLPPQWQIYPSFVEDFSFSTSLSSDGTLFAELPNLTYRGILAPGGSMIVLQLETTSVADVTEQFPGFPGTGIYIGLPRGTSCNDSTLSGDYNMASLGTIHEDTDVGGFDGRFTTQTRAFTAEFDGAGNFSLPQRSVKERALAFGEQPSLTATSFSESSEVSTYTVASDCTVTVIEADGALGNQLNGIVSPDGETLILGRFANDGNLAGEAFVELLAGFRAP